MRPYGSVLWRRFDTHPPILLRLLARHPRGAPLDSQEIADRCGLSVTQVDAISQQCDWRGVDLPTLRAFLTGTGCDLFNRRQFQRIRAYLRTKPRDPTNRFGFLKHSDRWKTYYLPLIDRFLDSLRRQ